MRARTFRRFAHQHALDIEQAGRRVDARGRVGPQPQELVRRRLARDHGADAVIFGGDLERHLAAMAHAHIADPLRRDDGQRLGIFDDRDDVLVFQRPAVEELPVLPHVLDQPADLVVGVVDLGAIAHPGDRIAGGEELLLRPAPVLREVAHHRHAAAAVAGCKQHERKRPAARRRAQADRRIEAVDHLDIHQLHGDFGIPHRFGDDNVLRVDADRRRRARRRRLDFGVHSINLPDVGPQARRTYLFRDPRMAGMAPSHCCCDRHQICRFGTSWLRWRVVPTRML